MVYKKFCFKGGLTIFLLLGILSGSLPSLFTLLNFQSWNSRSLYIHPFLSERNFKLPLWNIVENSPTCDTEYESSTFRILGYTKKKKEISITFFKFLPSKFSLLYIFPPWEKKNNNFKLCHVTTTIQSDCHLSNHRIQYRSPIRTASRVVLRRSTAGPISEIFGVEESNTDNRPNPWWWWRPVVSRKPADPWNTIRTIPLRIARGIQYSTRRTSGKIPKTAPKFLKFPRARARFANGNCYAEREKNVLTLNVSRRSNRIRINYRAWRDLSWVCRAFVP